MRMAIGIAIKAAATKASRPVLGSLAARTEEPARATPRRTSAHEPESTTLAVIITSVAVVMPAQAMKIRTAFPAGCVAQASTVWVRAVIAGVFGRPARFLEGLGTHFPRTDHLPALQPSPSREMPRVASRSSWSWNHTVWYESTLSAT